MSHRHADRGGLMVHANGSDSLPEACRKDHFARAARHAINMGYTSLPQCPGDHISAIQWRGRTFRFEQATPFWRQLSDSLGKSCRGILWFVVAHELGSLTLLLLLLPPNVLVGHAFDFCQQVLQNPRVL